MARPRKTTNNYPVNLYKSGEYFRYKNPETKKYCGLGKSKSKAIYAANALNMLFEYGKEIQDKQNPLIRSVLNLDQRFSNKDNQRLYTIWANMKNRCNNKNNDGYKYYGGKGISVCDEWNDSFTNFYNWAIKNQYRNTLTIDRIDGNGNYNPENCRWVNMSTQANNKSNNLQITHNGKTQNLSQWAKELNINRTTLWHRIYKLNIPISKAFMKSVQK